jgi:hypothetical protein
MFFVLLEIGEGDFEYSTLERVVGVFETSCAIDEGFSDSIRYAISIGFLFSMIDWDRVLERHLDAILFVVHTVGWRKWMEP